MNNIQFYSTLLELYNFAQDAFELEFGSLKSITCTKNNISLMGTNFKDYKFNKTEYERLWTEKMLLLFKATNLEKTIILNSQSFDDFKKSCV
jgi:hypothetical protein